MADKRKLNSVEEQRARQRELIELKRQKEAFNENPKGYTPQPTDDVAVEQTTASKLSNFWYYSKYTIAFIVIVAIILAISIGSCVTKTKYDLTIVLYFKTYANSTMSENLATVAEEYCEDYNGDGKVEVLVVNCSIPDDHRLTDSDGTTRLLGQFQNEEAIVYIVDTGAYNDLESSFGYDFLDNSLNLPHLDGTAFQLNATAFDAAFNVVSEDYTANFDYYIMRRAINENSTANKGDVKEYSAHADAFIRSVMADPYMNGGKPLESKPSSTVSDTQSAVSKIEDTNSETQSADTTSGE